MLDTIFAIHSTSRNLQHLPLRQGFVSRSRLKGLRELALLLLETAAHSTLNRTPEKSAVTRHERSSWHQREREREPGPLQTSAPPPGTTRVTRPIPGRMQRPAAAPCEASSPLDRAATEPKHPRRREISWKLRSFGFGCGLASERIWSNEREEVDQV